MLKGNLEKYRGIFPAFYACYDEEGQVSVERTKAFARHLAKKGVHGLYVGGSSGECIYLSKEERKKTLEAVMDEVKGELVVIAHVACNNTADSAELASHAESLGVDAIAAIPPIYFHLPDHAIAKYWNDISAAAPNTDFFIYNIPQLAGVALNVSLLRKMLENPRVVGVKNSSPAVEDITKWRAEGALVFNGPDEQLASGLLAGACGGIGGTYAAMPELYLAIWKRVCDGKICEACEIQDECCKIIWALCSGRGNMYAMIKEVLRINEKIDIGGARPPLFTLDGADKALAVEIAAKIRDAIGKFAK